LGRSNSDIYSAAKLLIDPHGDDPSVRAAHQTDELLEFGSPNGTMIWRLILKAIEEFGWEKWVGEAVK